MGAKLTGTLCVYDSRGAGKQTEEFCCHAVECGGGGFSKHDPVWVIEVLKADVWGQAKHITLISVTGQSFSLYRPVVQQRFSKVFGTVTQ